MKNPLLIHSDPAASKSRHLHNSSLMHQLATTFDGKFANSGVMFDIRSSPLVAVTVRSLSFHTLTKGQCDVEVYTKKKKHVYFETVPTEWTNVLIRNLECLGLGIETILDENMFTDMHELEIEKGAERAFYIRVSGTDIVYSKTTSFDEVYVEDGHIQILEGTALDSYFEGYSAPRMWNGRVSYSTETNSVHPDSGSCARHIKTESSESKSTNFGIMFDVTSLASSDLTIQGVALQTDILAPNEVQYEIFTIPDGFQLGKGSMFPWAPIAEGSRKPDPSGILTVSDENFENIRLRPGKTKGLFITLKSKNLWYHTTTLSVGSTYVMNEDISVSVGVGVGSYPQADTFYNSRGFYGNILYMSNDSCDLESTVPYHFVVHYPKDWSAIDVSSEIEFRVKTVFPKLLETDIILLILHQKYKLDLQKVVPTEDSGDLGEFYLNAPCIFSFCVFPHFDSTFGNSGPCTTTKANYRCARMKTDLFFSHSDGADAGFIEFALLQNAERVRKRLSLGDLEVYYAGDEPLDSRFVITLSGVSNKRMGLEEIKLFERTTKLYLKEHAESGKVKVLAVEVQLQNLAAAGGSGNTSLRKLVGDTSTIDITTVITGAHRPPSPGLNFDALIEDSVNSEDSTFKEELIQSSTESGIEYFSSVEEIRALSVRTVSPTVSPGGALVYGEFDVGEKGLGLVANIGIIVGAALFTFAVVFGAFLCRKRRQEQKRFKLNMEIDSDDEDDPLFVDIWKSKRSIKEDRKVPPKSAFNKKADEEDDFDDSAVSSDIRRSMDTNRTHVSDETPLAKGGNRRSDPRKIRDQIRQSSSQYNNSRHSQPSSRSIGRGSNTSSQEEIKDVNGRYPPSRRNLNGNSFVSIDIHDGLERLVKRKSRRNEFGDDNSSLMSSSTSSTISTQGKMPSVPSRRNAYL